MKQPKPCHRQNPSRDPNSTYKQCACCLCLTQKYLLIATESNCALRLPASSPHTLCGLKNQDWMLLPQNVSEVQVLHQRYSPAVMVRLKVVGGELDQYSSYQKETCWACVYSAWWCKYLLHIQNLLTSLQSSFVQLVFIRKSNHLTVPSSPQDKKVYGSFGTVIICRQKQKEKLWDINLHLTTCQLQTKTWLTQKYYQPHFVAFISFTLHSSHNIIPHKQCHSGRWTGTACWFLGSSLCVCRKWCHLLSRTQSVDH